MDVSGAAACDDTLFHCSSCSGQSILHTHLGFLHLGLGSSADTDHSYAAGQLGQSLLQFLFIELGSGLFQLCLDLCNTILDILGGAKSVYDDGVLLGDLYALCTAELLHGRFLQVQAELIGDDRAACQDRDILQHFFSSVAITGGLYTDNSEGSAQLVDDQCGKGLTLDILSNDEKLCAALYDLLKDRQDFLDAADLLIGDQDVGILHLRFHLLHIGAHISGNVTAVELHTFYQVELGVHGLGLFDGDDTVSGDLLHCLSDHLTDFVAAGGDRCYTCDLVLAGNGLAHSGNCFYCSIRRFLHTAAKYDGIRTCCQVLHALVYHSLCKNSRCRGAVTGNIVGLGSNFLDQLCAHVLERIGKLDLFCDGHAVIGDQG